MRPRARERGRDRRGAAVGLRHVHGDARLLSHRVVHLDELEAVPGPGTLTWHPVRATLGIRAFGCNGYSAARVGDDVVEPHTEDTSEHEELYFVARGRACFTIDDDTFEAPTGTYVFLPDPASRRHATALEPGTTVLSFGGPPRFEPSAWEWKFRALALLDTDPARAREVLEDGLAHHPDNAGLHYAMAVVELRPGDRDAARAALDRAAQGDPASLEEARGDPWLKALFDG